MPTLYRKAAVTLDRNPEIRAADTVPGVAARARRQRGDEGREPRGWWCLATTTSAFIAPWTFNPLVIGSDPEAPAPARFASPFIAASSTDLKHRLLAVRIAVARVWRVVTAEFPCIRPITTEEACKSVFEPIHFGDVVIRAVPLELVGSRFWIQWVELVHIHLSPI